MNVQSSRQLAILHIVSGDLWAGAEKVVATLLCNLHEYHQVNVTALILNRGQLSETLQAYGIETVILDEQQFGFHNIAWSAVMKFWGRKFDLIHAHRYKENLLAYGIAKAIGTSSLISTVHGLAEPIGTTCARSWKPGWQGMDHAVIKRAFSGVVAVSHEMRDVLAGKYRFPQDRLRVIHNGIEVPESDSDTALRKGYLHVATIARLVPIKDISLFLRVAAEVRKTVPKVRFSILGDGPLKMDLIKERDSLGLMECLTFEPMTDDPFAFLRTVDVFINTSLHEGIPLSVLEAMACRVPVIASSVGGLPEIITHESNGILISGRAPVMFADWCVRLIRDRTLREVLGSEASRTIKSNFSGRSMARKYYEYYSAVS